MERDNPDSEYEATPHGLEDYVHPVHADSVISMEKVQAEQISRKLETVEESSSREDGGWTIVNGAASDRADRYTYRG